jgi:dTDP-4-amino-4,6-dideoxygalactose transaminase
VNVPFLDLARYLPGEKERLARAAERVLARGRFVLGPEVEAFEQEFAAFVGAAYAVGIATEPTPSRSVSRRWESAPVSVLTVS